MIPALIIIRALPIFPVLLAALALLGWAWDIEVLKDGMSGSIAMNPTTAVCLILLAFEAIRLNTSNAHAALYKAGQLAIIIVIAVSLMKLSDIMFGSSFAIDQYIFSSKLDTELIQPSRMAPNTALCFFVLGWAMQCMRRRSAQFVFGAQMLAIAAMLLALLALIGHLFNILTFSGLAHYIPMPVNTAIAFLFTSLSVLFICPDQGFMQVFTSKDSSSSKTITNIILPASIMIPLAFGWLSHTAVEDLGWFNFEFALVLSIIMNIVALSFLSYFSAQRLFLIDIKRKQAEIALLQSQSDLQEAQRIAHVGSWQLDLATNQVIWSEELYIMQGLNPKLPLPDYTEHQKLFTSEGWERLNDALQHTMAYGVPYELELEIVKPDGSLGWILTRGEAIRNASGSIVKLHGVAADITERKQAELKAAALIHHNQVLMQSTSEGIHVLDEQGKVIEANKAFCHHLGYTMEEVLQLRVFDFDAKLFIADELNANLKEMQNGQATFETVHRRKDGSLVDVEINISSVDLDGQKCLFALSRDITQKKEAEQIIWKQANFDALTGLLNRHIFYDRVEQEIKKSTRSGTPFALMFIDLDHFKAVNDTLGHDMGDVLLIEATRRIADCVRATDIVARIGGDEFTVLLTEVDDLSSVERIAQNIIKQLAASFQLKNEIAYVSASIGITLYPNDAIDTEGLLKNADQAMYVSKNQGRNRHNYFTPALHEAAQTKLRLVNDLRGALAADQFMVYFQPIVELATGNIHKAEALIRWKHPERGLVSPAQFIPLAEETGLILGIGDWVFHESMRYAKRWRTLYNPLFQISVNKSPIQFYQDREDHTAWLSYLKEIDLPGQGLAIEITEGLLLDSNTLVNGALLTLRNANIQVSIDDFGTGYSSLSYLKKFDIDYLKIDQSFVHNLKAGHNDLALCEAIIVMAHKLGIKVIAEGVETSEQSDLLAAAGCDYAQGYLYSRPISAEEFEGLLKQR